MLEVAFSYGFQIHIYPEPALLQKSADTRLANLEKLTMYTHIPYQNNFSITKLMHYEYSLKRLAKAILTKILYKNIILMYMNIFTLIFNQNKNFTYQMNVESRITVFHIFSM